MHGHTPGPWLAEPSPTGVGWNVFAIGGDSDKLVVEVLDTDDDEADARLIAAAPDMLAMLRRIAPVLQQQGPATPSDLWQDLWALIDKAEGGKP